MGGTLHGPAPNQGADTTTRGRSIMASAMPGTARMGQIERGGFEGPITTASALAMAAKTPGAGDASAAPSNRRSVTFIAVLAINEVLPKRQPLFRGDSDLGADGIVSGGEDGLVEPMHLAYASGDLRERHISVQFHRAKKLRGQISVAEPHGCVGSKLVEMVYYRERVTSESQPASPSIPAMVYTTVSRSGETATP